MPDMTAGPVTRPVARPACLADRRLSTCRIFRAGPGGSGDESLRLERTSPNVQIEYATQCVTAQMRGRLDSYQLRCVLPGAESVTGVGARIRLGNWRNIKYVAIGYSQNGTFKHVKASNPAQGTWFDLFCGHEDVAWGLGNHWEEAKVVAISDIRVYVKGEPDGEAEISLQSMFCWREDGLPEFIVAPAQRPNAAAIAAIDRYLKVSVTDFGGQAEMFMSRGVAPLGNRICIDWNALDPVPAGLGATSTYQFSWHAQRPAMILMLQYLETGHMPPLFAARDLIGEWLTRSFYSPDLNLKYTWYDHGTAERCLAFLRMYAIGIELGFDHRFMERLRYATFRHAQLLASEVFYARDQPYRYHNHAWFQDVALLAASTAFPLWPCSDYWRGIAVSRLEDQFEKLIVREDGYAVFVENSIGYHAVVQSLTAFAGELECAGWKSGNIACVAEELKRFSRYLRYPDGRSPAQGDTFRKPNPSKIDDRGRRPYAQPEVTLLTRSGYGIVKGDHMNRPFMISMFATSLSRTHKHEDNLSLVLAFDGIEWLIDPSFCSHEYHQPIPAYLRSAAAHNVVCFPGRPYSIEPGCARLSGQSDGHRFRWEGEHTAYEGIVIRRSVTGPLRELSLEIDDVAQPREAERPPGFLMFHCGEGVNATVVGSKVELRHPESLFRLELAFDTDHIRKYRGMINSDGIRGMAAHGYGEATPIDCLEVDFDVDGMVWTLVAKKEL